jgi:hypothetical protein
VAVTISNVSTLANSSTPGANTSADPLKIRFKQDQHANVQIATFGTEDEKKEWMKNRRHYLFFRSYD